MIVSRTINTLFMIPTLNLTSEQLQVHGFIEAYERDGKRDPLEQYEDAVYLLFKPKNLKTFSDFIEFQYERSSPLIDDYDYEEGHVVLVYELPSEYKRDFNLIKKGKYSKTSSMFQSIFKKEVNIVVKGLTVKDDSFQNMVFNKSPVLLEYWKKDVGIEIPPDKEYWSLYNIDKETLKL